MPGPIAAQLGEYLRAGWPSPSVLTAPASSAELWPEGLRVEFENIRAGISRTAPAAGYSPAVREIEAFYLAAIAATEHCDEVLVPNPLHGFRWELSLPLERLLERRNAS
jgi:hypothetical protein